MLYVSSGHPHRAASAVAFPSVPVAVRPEKAGRRLPRPAICILPESALVQVRRRLEYYLRRVRGPEASRPYGRHKFSDCRSFPSVNSKHYGEKLARILHSTLRRLRPLKSGSDERCGSTAIGGFRTSAASAACGSGRKVDTPPLKGCCRAPDGR